MREPSRTILPLILAVCLASWPAEARPRQKPPTEPGHYAGWNNEIDELDVVRSFKLADYDRIVVEPLDTSETPLPEEDDNSYAPARNVLSTATKPWAKGIRFGVDEEIPVVLSDGKEDPEPRTLRIRGEVLEMHPGSRAARYWSGIAGEAHTRVRCEVVDAASGEVLLRFHQERRSGTGGMFGGGYEDVMTRNLRQIGEDLGAVLRAF
ncbi:MAG TPA: DUF4410 domain-containing protein [Thermoanaerobaculia bacterium]|nr:DUF4410 domain-containing protein [Thermoanaerobaculia bacterium]